MFHLKKNKLLLLFSVLLFLSLIQLSSATVLDFTVRAGDEVTRPMTLTVEDRVVIKFTVVGGQGGNTLDFRLAYPNGTEGGF
ncbi:hypothetical protein A3K79_01845 [Candidatus Bathyarchaeota archaeon RBG_13_46_16b]|nr:MAG: hypothetical protein A3K79_01845 [Candidatus Bathyarchaeota archaeon RBG_13_46_16b]